MAGNTTWSYMALSSRSGEASCITTYLPLPITLFCLLSSLCVYVTVCSCGEVIRSFHWWQLNMGIPWSHLVNGIEGRTDYSTALRLLPLGMGMILIILVTRETRVGPITLVVGSWSSVSLSSRIAFSCPCMYRSSWSEQTKTHRQINYQRLHEAMLSHSIVKWLSHWTQCLRVQTSIKMKVIVFCK